MSGKIPEMGRSDVLGRHVTNPSEPKVVGETVYALGKEWTVSSCESRIKAQFEQHLRRKALRSIDEAEEDGAGPDTVRRMTSSYMADKAAGHYNWDLIPGAAIRNALRDMSGISYLLFLLIRRCHPEIKEDQAKQILMEKPRDVTRAIRIAMGNSLGEETMNSSQTQNPQIADTEEMTLDDGLLDPTPN